MPTEESLPMYLILLKKRRQHILFLLIFVCLLVFWVNFHLSRHLNERVPNCNIPCIGTTCINCLTEEREEKIPRINILEKLKLKQVFRVRKLPPRGDADASDQICKRPNFDAKHDSIKYAFHSMEKLNCTGESLFKVENAVFKLDRNVLKGRELERCDYYGIVRITDDYSSYSEPLTRKAEPFDLLIKEDFVRIKCFLKKAEDDKESESGRKARKLLQLNSDNVQKDVNPIALRLAKTLWSFGRSERNRVNTSKDLQNLSEIQQLIKTLWSFGQSERNRVNTSKDLQNLSEIYQLIKTLWSFAQSKRNRVNTSKDIQNLSEIQQLIKAAYYKSNNVSFNEAKLSVERQNYKLLLDKLRMLMQHSKRAAVETESKHMQLKSNMRLKEIDEMVNDENYQILLDELQTLIQNGKRAEVETESKHSQLKSNRRLKEVDKMINDENYQILLDELQTLIQNGKRAEVETESKHSQLKSNRRLKEVDKMINDENYQILLDELRTLIQNSMRADYEIEGKHTQLKSNKRLKDLEVDKMVSDENHQLLLDALRTLIENSKIADELRTLIQLSMRADYEIEGKHTQLKSNRRLQEVDKDVNDEGNPKDGEELIINDMEMDDNIEALGNESDPIFDYAMYADQLEEEPADFDQFIVQVYPKEGVHRRILKQVRELNAERKHLRELSMNVLIFGLDSMSHMSYQRKLPKTYSFLRDKLGAVILHGYNIVGDATTAALLPMLTGKAETELPEARKKHILADYVDRFPLIWNDFRDHGYVTMFAEDEPTIGAFNLRLSGFDNQPTDHYMRPFWTSLWESDLRLSRPRFCTGNVPNHMFLLNYTRSFFDSYKNVSKFAFVFGSELTHWNNNPGEYMDGDFVEFLEYFQSQGHLKNTLLVLMSDHGARYSAVRKTVQGKLEERLPMMSFVFPDWFRDKFPNLYNNLVNNSDRLSTPFDIYETLKHVLDIHKMSGNVNHMLNSHNIPRGISLLHPIPRNRTCTMAEIDMHWCTCLKQVELHSRDLHVMKAVDSLVKRINNETKFVRDQCVELHFKRVHSAYLLIPNEQVLMFQKTKDEDNRVANFNSSISVDHAHFQITIETLPNHGMFEATVQVNMTAGSYLVMDGISRLDMYGNQPACVQDKYPDLRKYCYCKNTAQ